MGISREEAIDCFRSDDLIGLGMEADAIRRKLHPENVVTYTVGGSIDCTLPEEDFCGRAGELVDSGATVIALRDNHQHSDSIERFERRLRRIKSRYAGTVLCLSDSEVVEMARASGVPLRDAVARLRDAGIGMILGGKADCEEWMAVHRAAHQCGLQSVADLPYSGDGAFDNCVSRLEAIRRIQEETGGFTACMPRVMAAKGTEEPTAVEYLKTLAIARIFLDGFNNIETQLDMNDLKVLQVSLRFGANDAGDAEAVNEERLRYVIRDAGFRPAQWDALYNTMFLN